MYQLCYLGIMCNLGRGRWLAKIGISSKSPHIWHTSVSNACVICVSMMFLPSISG